MESRVIGTLSWVGGISMLRCKTTLGALEDERRSRGESVEVESGVEE